MTKAHPKFQGLSRMQMRDIYHALTSGGKTPRQLAIKYGVTERTVMAARREVRRSLRSRAVAA
jgi:DNA-binding CsgD family transcriptional regulator